jgi:hypothetical protein
MPYQNNQPLGTSAQGGGGGWRALSFMNSTQKDKLTPQSQQKDKLTPQSKSLLKDSAGPNTVTGAVNWYDQMMSVLGKGTEQYGFGSQLNKSPYQNAYKGYTAGTGVGNQQSKSSY